MQNHRDPRFTLKYNNFMSNNQLSEKLIKQSSGNAMESSYEEVIEASRPGYANVDSERKAVGEAMIHERNFVELPPISTKQNIAYATSTIKHAAF